MKTICDTREMTQFKIFKVEEWNDEKIENLSIEFFFKFQNFHSSEYFTKFLVICQTLIVSR